MEKKHEVEYLSGPGEYEEAVDYMMVEIDGITLYAEYPFDENDETASYEPLVEMITEQAKEKGINPNRLRFWYDPRESDPEEKD